MSRRFTVPGILVDEGAVVADGDGRRSVYITDVIYTGGLPSDYVANGGATNIGPIQTMLTSTYNWHFSTPIRAPDGFTVLDNHKVIYYCD